MRELSQKNGCLRARAPSGFGLLFPGRLSLRRAVVILLVFWPFAVHFASAQTFRLGPFNMNMVGTVDLAYDSNVDDLAEQEEDKPGKARSDFYWMPRLSITSEGVPMRPSTTLGLSANAGYQYYLQRLDLNTETYNFTANFQTAHPRLTLNGSASAIYDISSMDHEYVPGGVKRDPTLTHLANVAASWKYRRLRLEGAASFTRERHDYEEYWEGDNDESTLMVGAYLDLLAKLSMNATWQKTLTTFTLEDKTTDEVAMTWGANWNLFSWGGFYYTWENTTTVSQPGGDEADETTITFGLTGAIPVEFLRRPKLTYSLGYQYEEETSPDGEVTKKWQPVHTITASDEFQISKTVLLAGNATWSDDVDVDEVQFQYNVNLSQQLGARARHALAFTQEPRPTFGSTSDTETTTYGYTFSVRDLLFYNLSFSFGATYEESTPLGVSDAETEKTTNLTAGLTHTRALSRKLSRTLSYTYTWEKSNFDEMGPTIKHLVVYGLAYQF